MEQIMVGLVIISAFGYVAYQGYCLLVKKEIRTCCDYCPGKDRCKNRLD